MTDYLNEAKGLMSRMREVRPAFRGLETMELEPGAISAVPAYLKRQGLNSPIVVADANTYEAAGQMLMEGLETEGLEPRLCLIKPDKLGDVVADERSLMQLLSRWSQSGQDASSLPDPAPFMTLPALSLIGAASRSSLYLRRLRWTALLRPARRSWFGDQADLCGNGSHRHIRRPGYPCESAAAAYSGGVWRYARQIYVSAGLEILLDHGRRALR